MSTSSTYLNKICKVLETNKGRDKILRTLCYTTKLLGSIHSDKPVSAKLLKFSKIMSETRATLRLLDDLPMLKYTMEYGLGEEENDKFMATLGVTTNVIDQLYYPIEKIAWLAEYKLIDNVNSDKWDTLSSIFWVASIYLNLIKTLRYVSIIYKYNRSLNFKNNENAVCGKILIKQEILTCIRLSLDFIHAINTLPKGFLWSSKLNNWQIGVIASLSSFLGLYQIFSKVQL